MNREGVDRTVLMSREVPFKELTPMAMFNPAVMQEIEAKGIELVTAKDKKWWTILQKLRNHDGNNVALRPWTPFENFAWR